ncbi:MAG: hypothetical protein ACM3XN_05580 [Chloroflexota bacterium]
MRKELPLALTVLSGLWVMACKYLQPVAKLDLFTKTERWFVISATVAFLVGTINLIMVHGKNVMRRKEGWYNSAILLLVLFAYSIHGLIKTYDDPGWKWYWNNVWTPVNSTMFSLLCFYIASSAYRAFRVRTREATIMLVAACIVMLGNVPLGKMIWSEIPNIKNWIMAVPNSAGMRAITLGAYVGTFAVAMRILLGLERAHLGSGGQ